MLENPREVLAHSAGTSAPFGVGQALLAVAAVAMCALAADRILGLDSVGSSMWDNRFLYVTMLLLLPPVFVVAPGIHERALPAKVLDIALAIGAFALILLWVIHARDMSASAWEFAAPAWTMPLTVVTWLLVLEATRRTGGTAVALIALLMSLYPVVADLMPGPIAGFSQGFSDTLAYHVFSMESVLGVPLAAFANLVIGFVVFGVALRFSGASDFFNNLAFFLFGGVRGGAAKVSIFASGAMGSMSGSVVSNVISTGSITIPVMTRTGFSRVHAAAIEACASTGGVMAPPVMGAAAFVMATFLSVPYYEVALAALVPSLLFYFGLFLQVDAYAAKAKLKGLPREELPELGQTLRAGWRYFIAFAVLIYFILQPGQEAGAPFYATVVLGALELVASRGRISWPHLLNFLSETGHALATLGAMLAGVGLIVGGLVLSGLAGTLANDLVFIAGKSTLALLLMGAVTSFLFGMGMTMVAAYIFLALVLAPALVQGSGLDPLAVHMFILYWGMVSFITPPVAIGAYAAATLAKVSPMKVGLESVRFGAVIYFVPFLFVLNPDLLFRGEFLAGIEALAYSAVAVALAAAGLQGWLLGVGALGGGIQGLLLRAVLFAGAIFMGFATVLDLSGGRLGALAITVGVIAVVAWRVRK
ncbi:MAG: TRAP transporter fused permease subunit [Aquisalimonadaceae bacterium]